MKPLSEIQSDYVNKQNDITKVQEKIHKLEAQINRLRTKKDKLQDKAWWGDNLIRPIMEHVKAKFPDLVWDDKNLVPMGLGCKVSIFAHLNGETVAYLVFSPGNSKTGTILYETGETKNNFHHNSIGAMNGFNNVSKVVETIGEVLDYVQKQIDKHNAEKVANSK